MNQYRLHAFGPPQLTHNDKVIHLRRKKALALLVYLATEQQAVARSALCAIFWPELEQKRAESNLRTVLSAVSELSKAKILTANRQFIQLDGSNCFSCDLWDFEGAIKEFQVKSEIPATASVPKIDGDSKSLRNLEQAVNLYKTGLAAGFDLGNNEVFDNWRSNRFEYYRNEYLFALQKIIDYRFREKNWELLILYGQRYLHEDPLSSEITQILLKAYNIIDRKDLAAELYHGYLDVLRSELGVSPSEEVVLAFKGVLDRNSTEKDNSTLIGRSVEYRLLTDMVASLDNGKGHFFMITGAVGMGKTTLVNHLIEYAQDCGILCLTGQCTAETKTDTNWPWIQIFKRFGALSDDTGDSELYKNPAIPAKKFRQRILESILQVCRHQPCVILLEDIHWADSSSLQILRHIAPLVVTLPIVIMATVREKKILLAETMGQTIDSGHFTPLLLAPLTKNDMKQYSRTRSDIDYDDEVWPEIMLLSDGNPLYLKEIADNYASRGHVDLPEKIHEIISAQISQIPSDEREVVTVCSLLEGNIHINLLQRILGDDDRCLQTIESCIEKGVIEIEPEEPGHLRVASQTTKSTINKELSPSLKSELHEKIADSFEIFYGAEADFHAEELAHHFSCSLTKTGIQKSAIYAQKAGERAASQNRYAEARHYYRLALSAIDSEQISDAKAECLIGVSKLLLDRIWLVPSTANELELQNYISVLCDYFITTGQIERLGTFLADCPPYSSYYPKFSQALFHVSELLDNASLNQLIVKLISREPIQRKTIRGVTNELSIRAKDGRTLQRLIKHNIPHNRRTISPRLARKLCLLVRNHRHHEGPIGDPVTRLLFTLSCSNARCFPNPANALPLVIEMIELAQREKNIHWHSVLLYKKVRALRISGAYSIAMKIAFSTINRNLAGAALYQEIALLYLDQGNHVECRAAFQHYTKFVANGALFSAWLLPSFWHTAGVYMLRFGLELVDIKTRKKIASIQFDAAIRNSQKFYELCAAIVERKIQAALSIYDDIDFESFDDPSLCRHIKALLTAMTGSNRRANHYFRSALRACVKDGRIANQPWILLDQIRSVPDSDTKSRRNNRLARRVLQIAGESDHFKESLKSYIL